MKMGRVVGARVLMRRTRKAVENDLLNVLRSEINHELSSPSLCQGWEQNSSLGDFVVDWDASRSQDVVLRKKCNSGEDIAVSSLLGPWIFANGSAYAREVLLKVFVKKPSLQSVMQFDCCVSPEGSGRSKFDIIDASYFRSASCPKPSAYRGPLFSTLDPNLQCALKEYLISKGIDDNLTNFLLVHLHKKEQGQYIQWLQKLESLVAKGNH